MTNQMSNWNTSECEVCGEIYTSQTDHECTSESLALAADALLDCGQEDAADEMFLSALDALTEEIGF